MSRLNGFLGDVRVVDLSTHFPGSLVSLLLADMGARVVKVEPVGGLGMRRAGPKDANGRLVWFDAINAGKETIELDLKDPAGKAMLTSLLVGADVVLESFRPGVMTRLGFGSAALRARDARLVYCAMNGFGETGPMMKTAAHDANFLAMAGILDRNGTDAATLIDPPLADCAAVMFAFSTILGALRARDRDGVGCHLDCALADATMPWQMMQVAEYGTTGHVPSRGVERLNGGLACYSLYKTADGGTMAVCALEHKFWQMFSERAGRPDWTARHAEPTPQTALKAEVTAFFSTLTLAAATAMFETADCCVSPVLSLGEALEHPHHKSRGLIRRDASGLLQSLYPVLVDGEPPADRAPVKALHAGVAGSEQG